MKKTKHPRYRFLDEKIIKRLKGYKGIALIFLVIVTIEVISGYFNPFLALLGILAGVVIGIISSRIFHLQWDEESAQVISNMDRLGVVVLLLYLLVVIYRRFFLEGYFEGTPLLILTLSIIAGTMIGRLLTTIVVVKRIMRRVGL
ncbi:MAG: hypothetical protein KKF16_09400 [Euryarchaeota archaeon]|nr:hypothetical protein [Euryarchaeota archaeon]MBU4548276.1 hypothetical protein [Euryarchaeota archaeon]MBU4607424.1 hypothetical protein [Euryarchaeota archaeon]MBV1730128.1 hypothetical protein [Methanobacterium sp.]MBV1754059.1 hypothetical protein [Methanobacterium sp.]